MNPSDSNHQVISVAVPRPIHGLFTYRLPISYASKIRMGGWVRVPFGRTKTHAFVVEDPKPAHTLPDHLSYDNLKDIMEVGDPEFCIPSDVLALCRWAHEYYCAPLGEVLNCAASSAGLNLKKGLKSTPREVTLSEYSNPLNAMAHPTLTSDQLKAVDFFDHARQESHNQSSKIRTALLHGVTGSGKTEVYIELAKRVLNEEKGVIILVPEIALTPQLHQRFERGLGCPVALWHSALSDGKKRDLSYALRSGKLKTVVGARSAIFAPVQNLGLIVVDEEHDSTYKQEDRVKYHARDLAIVRAKLSNAFTILGSATPSFETRERVREGRYRKIILSQRVTAGGLPSVELVDLRQELEHKKIEDRHKEKTQALLAEVTLQKIQATLDAGEQVLVYLNRRGFAAFLLCRDCGDVKDCPQCSISLTVHKKKILLRCHVCGHQEPIPDLCRKCQGIQLTPMGAGTESLEIELPKLLQGALISRLDRDQVTSASRLTTILDEFRSGKSNLLLGTQMLVKGHDFPGVTLVVVILADALFKWPDFRATERAFQVLQQVSGRAGRREKPGKVLIQTFDVNHPVLQVLTNNLTEEAFLNSERDLREALNYPPFSRLVCLRFESTDRTEAIHRAKAAATQLEQFLNRMNSSSNLSGHSLGPTKPQLEILGPSEAFLEKVKGTYRWDLLLKSKNIQILQHSIRFLHEFSAQQKWPFLVDVDPYSM